MQDRDADFAVGVDCGGVRPAWEGSGRDRGVDLKEGREGKIPFGWKIGVWNFIVGGRRGYSNGNRRWAR